ncbi:MAG: hypothetical protein UIH27_11725 [Ruminococcus sp.]|nr:hypothetical protein [Ruminococcus sp.]
MELCTFYIDLMGEKIRFVFSDSDIKRPHKETLTVSFSTVSADLLNFDDASFEKLKTITDKLEKEIANGREINDSISAELYKIMFSSENVIERIAASVIEYHHLETKRQMKTSIKIKQWEKAIREFHANLYNEIIELKPVVENDFQFKKDSDFTISVTLGENRSSTIALSDSFAQFVKIFTYAVYQKDLHIFTCRHCGNKYLAVTDMRYCKEKECQQEKEKEQRRTKRQNRKYDIYVQPLDNFNDYTRGRLREMRLAGATEEEVSAFEELKLRHRDDLRNRLDSFKNQSKAPDKEFYQICDGYKKELKVRTDVVIKRNRKKV